MTYFLDLFSGIGGFALGAYWAGCRFDSHYFSEVDEYAIKIYKQRFPEAIGLGDIRNIRGDDLPTGDWIIAGGFPCQDISAAGKGAGLEGSWSGLWYEYARILAELRPSFAIIENVGALVGRGLDQVLGSLAEVGYDAEWQDIRASDVGAPHRRERIWIVAYPEGLRGVEPARRGRSPQGAIADGEAMADTTDSRDVRGNRELESAKEQVREDRGSPQDGGREWWATEPDVGRVAHGVPSRVDRLKCLGNSIIPQIAELIFQQSVFDRYKA